MADWRSSAVEASTTAFSMLRPLPPRPTERTEKLSSEMEDVARRHDAKGFGPDPETAAPRLAAFASGWGRSEEALAIVRQRLITPVFDQIHRHALATWGPTSGAAAAPATTPAALTADAREAPVPGGSEVPVVLLSIGASADHAHTCPELMRHLRHQGHPVALGNGRDLSNGSAAPLLHAAMRQFVGAATPADDVAALVGWWGDELKEKGGAAAAAAGDAAGADAAAPQSARVLRTRKDETPGGAAAGSGRTAGARCRALLPPVLVVSDGERADMPALQQLVKELSEERSRLPLVLVLAISKPAPLFVQLLPNEALRRCRLMLASFPAAAQQLQLGFRAALLPAPVPPLVLGPRVLRWLLEHFEMADGSATTLATALQLCQLEHALSQPLSTLAPALATGRRCKLRAALAKLPDESVAEMAAALQSGNGNLSSAQAAAGKGRSKADRAAVESAVWAAAEAFGRWRVAVLAMHALARSTGHDADPHMQLPQLFLAASPTPAAVAAGSSTTAADAALRRLLGGGGAIGAGCVAGMEDEEAAGVIRKLQQLIEGAMRPPQQEGTADDASSASGSEEEGGSESDAGDSSASDSDSSEEEEEEERRTRRGASKGAAVAAAAAAAPRSGRGRKPAVEPAPASAVPEPMPKGGRGRSRKATAGAAAPAPAPEPTPKRGRGRPRKVAAAAAAAEEGHKEAPILLDCNPSELSSSDSEDSGSEDSHGGNSSSSSDDDDSSSSDEEPDVQSSRDVAVPSGKGAKGRDQAASKKPKQQRSGAAASTSGAAAVGDWLLSDCPRLAALCAELARLLAVAEGSPGDDEVTMVPDSEEEQEAPAKEEEKEEQQQQPAKRRGRPPKAKGGNGGSSSGIGVTPLADALARGARVRSPTDGDKAAAAGGRGAPLPFGGAGSESTGDATAVAAAAAPRGRRRGAAAEASAPAAVVAADAVTPVAGRRAGRGRGQAQEEEGAAGPVAPTPLTEKFARAATLKSPEPAAADAKKGKGRRRGSGSNGEETAEGAPAAGDAGARANTSAAAAVVAAGAAAGGALAAGNRRTARLLQMTAGAGAAAAAAPATAGRAAARRGADGGAAAAAPAAQAPAPTTTAGRLARLLLETLPALLRPWQSKPAGAAALVFDDAALLRSALAPAPRAALHAALSQPWRLLPSCPREPGRQWEDACLAYSLLTRHRDASVPVGDWFGLFCAAQGLAVGEGDVEEEEGEGGSGGAGRRGRGRKGSHKICNDRTQGQGDTDAAPARGSDQRRGGGGGSGTAGAKRGAAAAGAGEEVDETRLLESAARFSQAAAELQLLGIWRPSKRRRVVAVQRVFAPMAVGGGLDTAGLDDEDCD